MRLHTRCALVIVVQTCALPIYIRETPRLDISKGIDLPGSPGNQTDTRILPLAAAVRPCQAQCSLVTEHKAAGLNLQRVGKRRYCPYVRGPVVICRPHAGWAPLLRRRCPETIAPVPASQIGRAHACTPVPNAPLVCRLLLDTTH